MDHKLSQIHANSDEWRDALEKALKQSSSSDVIVPHEQVAFAFPGRSFHIESFDIPSIEREELKEWAESQGWSVTFAPECASETRKRFPPVRFLRSEK